MVLSTFPVLQRGTDITGSAMGSEQTTEKNNVALETLEGQQLRRCWCPAGILPANAGCLWQPGTLTPAHSHASSLNPQNSTEEQGWPRLISQAWNMLGFFFLICQHFLHPNVARIHPTRSIIYSYLIVHRVKWLNMQPKILLCPCISKNSEKVPSRLHRVFRKSIIPEQRLASQNRLRPRDSFNIMRLVHPLSLDQHLSALSDPSSSPHFCQASLLLPFTPELLHPKPRIILK